MKSIFRRRKSESPFHNNNVTLGEFKNSNANLSSSTGAEIHLRARGDPVSISFEKAKLSPTLPDIFELLDLIISEENLSRKLDSLHHNHNHNHNNNSNNQEGSQFQEIQEKQTLLYKRLQKFLSLILQYRKSHPSRNYTIIFHEYMKTIQNEQQKDIFHYYNNSSYSTISNYIQILSFYVNNKDAQFAISSNSSEAMEILDEYYEEAHLLLKYLEEHKVDIYSSIIGLSPSRDLLKCTFHDTSKKDISYYFDIIPPRDLYESIIHWANSSDSPEQILSQIKHCSTLLRGLSHLKKGDLVILNVPPSLDIYDFEDEIIYNTNDLRNSRSDDININNNNINNNINNNETKSPGNSDDNNIKSKKKKYKIARYTGIYRNDKQTMELYISSLADSKKESITVKMEDVYPIPYYITKNLIEDHFFSFDKYVENGFFLYRSEMMDSFTILLRNYLQNDHSVPYSLLYKAIGNQCSILDLPSLKSSLEIINSLEIPNSFLKKLENDYESKLKLFCEKLNEVSVFYPTKDKSFDAVKNIPIDQVISKEVNKYKGMFECSLDQIEMQKRDLINGTRKMKLVEWWHTLISDSVTKFLISLDYSTGALPHNYTMIPPADLRKVTANLKILREIIDGNGRSLNLFNGVVEKLKLDIYERIDSFISDAALSILEFLGLPCTLNDIQKFNTSDVITIVNLKFPSKDSVNWVRELIKDLEYLETMKKLESPTCTEEEKRKAFHIVPISGLAFGVICRLENETKTAIEIWAPFDYMQKTFKDNRYKFHHAITMGDFNAIDNFLLKKKFNINEPDDSGWSPLHLAASSDKYFPICKKLIEYGAKVNIINEHGNIPLHYLAKCRLESNDTTNQLLQIDILKQMIEHGVNLDLKNSEGETPLFFACLLGNFEFVRILVFSLCSLVSVNNSNETCLHYAVQSNNNEVVRFLLENGANTKTKDKRGRTPLDLAIQFNAKDIISVFNSFTVRRTRKNTIVARWSLTSSDN